MTQSRVIAAKVCRAVIDQGRSLDDALAQHNTLANPKDRAFIQEIAYGICRWYGVLDQAAAQLLNKPLKPKDRDLHFLLLGGLYQLAFMSTADHAAISETVEGAKQLKKPWGAKLLNACLRRFQRQGKNLGNNDSLDPTLTHPQWLVSALQSDWPDHWQTIIDANNVRPPMSLRVNPRVHPRAEYLGLLEAASIDAQACTMTQHGINLVSPCPVQQLPEFDQGACSVQDIAAQIAVELLAPKPNTSILDACAAPGGKLTHLLEVTDNTAQVDALDIAPERLQRIQENLARLQLTAQIFCADARHKGAWPVPPDGYDQIMVDAPCSGTGVIRRHPDIRHHRRASDIPALVEQQQAILDACWQLLKPGGQLLYTTCSVLKAENEGVAAAFLNTHPDAQVHPLTHPCALNCELGNQTLPGVHPMDGFYYCAFDKR